MLTNLYHYYSLFVSFLHHEEVAKYENLFEIAAACQLKLAIRNLVAKTLIEKADPEKPVFSLDGLTVRVRKGHTCSRTWYLHFFHNMEAAMKKINNLQSIISEGIDKEKEKVEQFLDENSDIEITDDRNKNKYYLPAIKSKNIFLFEKNEDKKVKTYMDKFSFLQYLPLEIDIVGSLHSCVRNFFFSMFGCYFFQLFYFD